LGYLVNPGTIAFVPEGDHRLATYLNHDGVDFIGTEQDVTVTFAEVTEIEYQLVTGGAISITAAFNENILSEYGLKLNGTSYGVDAGPRTIGNIAEGRHKLVIWYDQINAPGDTTFIEGWQRNVRVELAETTFVYIEMQVVAPDSGFHAPDLECVDIDGNKHILSDHWGKVIYLYFFEYT